MSAENSSLVQVTVKGGGLYCVYLPQQIVDIMDGTLKSKHFL